MKKRLLITGSNGFIGQSFVENIDKSLYDVYALDIHNESYSNTKRIKDYMSVDISKPFHLNIDFDIVIHLAALNQTNINNDFTYEQFRSINVVGTENVVKSCSFKKFIFFSTANIYEKRGEKIDENSPIKAYTFYERTKYEGEQVCQRHIDNEKLVILRPVNVTGIKQANKAIIPYFFSRAINNEPIVVFVPKNRRIQLLSIKDLLRAVEAIISNNDINGVFNLSSTDSMEVEAIAKRIIRMCKSSSSLLCTNNNLENFSEVVSIKAKCLLNWYSQDTIETIINDFASLFLNQI